GRVRPSMPPCSSGWQLAHDRPRSRDSMTSPNNRSPRATRFESRSTYSGIGTKGSAGVESDVGADATSSVSVARAAATTARAVSVAAATAIADRIRREHPGRADTGGNRQVMRRSSAHCNEASLELDAALTVNDPHGWTCDTEHRAV